MVSSYMLMSRGKKAISETANYSQLWRTKEHHCHYGLILGLWRHWKCANEQLLKNVGHFGTLQEMWQNVTKCH